MTQREATCQSLASCGAFLIAFIGTVHEAVGAHLFPWAPVLFGPIVFHLIGVFVIVVGLLLLLGCLRIIRFPVVVAAIAASLAYAVMLNFIAVTYRLFHYFCLCVVIAGITTSLFHTQTARLRAVETA